MNYKFIVLVISIFSYLKISAQEQSVEVAVNRMVANINSMHDSSSEVNLAILGFKQVKGKKMDDLNAYLIKELTQGLQGTKRFKVLNQNMVNAVYNTSGVDVWKSASMNSYSQFSKEANLNIHIWKLVYGTLEDMDDSLAINLLTLSESAISDTFRIVFLANDITNKLLKKSKSENANFDNQTEVDTVSEITLDPIAIKDGVNEGVKVKELFDTIPQNIVFKTIGEIKVGVYAAERMGAELHIEVRICKNGELNEMPYVNVWFTNQKGKAFYKQFNTMTYRKLYEDKCINANVRFVDNTKRVKKLNTLTFELEGLGNLVFENVDVF